ncbi:hypothetical protein Prede_2596 [Prevotella dentalis DSM 3688]|uniref:Uncharacterized protein n=1 Tax=Prevotella dentalis (strain ATCC 49559 / DSM 3688 / JCM 13448 / NCTC 12043 / ES 2772) TaxID=908937 RepID=F9D799_PREDD|nr:hypothetical protein [Prevotella dentalis]AGB29739.1 hypothetical protein Prede_2493 [Prevotella dentalis DSM 3688]AGB29830.1 hypothetical protein Prede_2596 [Prevotella dentalis DSM 3688]EGQ11465.1 hypothetical protein HMPREF9136_2727 [Prevotella dentalis DSM 3688]
MDYSKLELRKKTFLDFNPSDEALDEIIGGHEQSDIDLFLSCLDEHNRFISYDSFIDFADKELARAIEQEFAEEIASFYNE